MGTPNDFQSPGISGGPGGGQSGQNGHLQQQQQTQTKATFSGMTALMSVIALVIAIISAAVPHWGYYSPIGAAYYASGLPSVDNTGNFGPFQVCTYTSRAYTYCGGLTFFNPTTWLKVAGACSIVVVVALGGMALFSVVHVAMQLQRREILVSFQKAVFLKLLFSSVAALGSIVAVIFGGLEFSLNGRTSALALRMGVCYYLQIVLIFVNVLLIILSYVSFKRAKTHPPHMVPKVKRDSSSNFSSAVYDNRKMQGPKACYGMDSISSSAPTTVPLSKDTFALSTTTSVTSEPLMFQEMGEVDCEEAFSRYYSSPESESPEETRVVRFDVEANNGGLRSCLKPALKRSRSSWEGFSANPAAGTFLKNQRVKKVEFQILPSRAGMRRSRSASLTSLINSSGLFSGEDLQPSKVFDEIIGNHRELEPCTYSRRPRPLLPIMSSRRHHQPFRRPQYRECGAECDMTTLEPYDL